MFITNLQLLGEFQVQFLTVFNQPEMVRDLFMIPVPDSRTMITCLRIVNSEMKRGSIS